MDWVKTYKVKISNMEIGKNEIYKKYSLAYFRDMLFLYLHRDHIYLYLPVNDKSCQHVLRLSMGFSWYHLVFLVAEV